MGLLHEQLHEFLLADRSVAVLVDLQEDVLDDLLRICRVIQEERDFFIGNHAGMVDIEIGKCLFEVALVEHVLHLESSHDELGEIDFSGAVGVDQSE